MNFQHFTLFIKSYNSYNPTLFQLINELLRFRSNSEISYQINFIFEMGFDEEYTEAELKMNLYNWIEYLLQNHNDLITLVSTRSDLIQKINDREILYDNDFIIPDVINNKKRVFSINNQTKVIGYVNDIFVNLKDFDVAILHFPYNSTLNDAFRIFDESNNYNISNRINLKRQEPEVFNFENIPSNEVINLQPSLDYLSYLYLFDRGKKYEENEIQQIVNSALTEVNQLCPFAKSIVFNGIMHPHHDNTANIEPVLNAINNFLENNETNFKFIYIISNNREILN